MKKICISIFSLILCTSTCFASGNATKETPDSVILDNRDIKSFIEYFISRPDQCKPDHSGESNVTQENKPSEDIPSYDESTPDKEELSFEEQVLMLINEERTSRGLGKLEADNELTSVARAHSKDMADRGYFSHNTPEGLTPFDRMRNAGISYRSAGENIAAGQETPEAVVEAWMNSDGHRENILKSSYTKTGVGCIYGGSYGIYWTQLFMS